MGKRNTASQDTQPKRDNTLHQKIEEYLQDCYQKYSPTYFRDINESLERFDKFMTERQVDVDKTGVRQYFMHIIATRKFSYSTVSKDYRLIGGFFKWCMLMDYVDKSPMVPFPMSRKALDRGNKTDNVVTDEEFEKLLECARKSRYTFMPFLFICARYTGLRRADISLLKWESVDWENEVLRVMPQKTSRSSGKVVEIPIEQNRLYPLLEQLAKNPIDIWPGKEFVRPDLTSLFLRSQGTDITCLTHRIFKRAGVRNKSFHGLRHSFTTELIRSGASPSVVAELRGDSGLTMVQRYTHHNLNDKREAMMAAWQKNQKTDEVPNNQLPSSSSGDQ